MSRQGQDFHRLVETLERAVSGQDGVTIESPKYLIDRVTGRKREHDIVLTYSFPHREVIVAIECRDRRKRVTVGQVEEFKTKCHDTKVDKGIIVASGGFAKTAREKAKHNGIDCFTLAQVDQVDWCSTTEIVIRDRKPTHVQLEIEIPKALLGTNWKLFQRTTGGSVEIDADKPDILINEVWPQIPDQGDELSGEVHVESNNLHDFYVVDQDGLEHSVRRLSLTIAWKAVETLSPLTFYRYAKEEDQPLSETFITGVETFGDICGRLMLVRDEVVGLRLEFISQEQVSETDSHSLSADNLK